jgi:hypothetical protein
MRRSQQHSSRPTNLSSKARSDIGLIRLRPQPRECGVACIALGCDLVSGQVDVLGTQLEEVVE